MPNSSNQYDSPPPPPVRPDVAEYVKAFNKPLTTDEKAAWLAEIVYRVLHGELPQEIYPALREHIEALPTVAASKDRTGEKLPGSDYAYPGPPKPLVATTTVFPNAMPLHEYKHQNSIRRQSRQKTDPSFGVLLFVIGVFVLAGIAYGIGSWTLKNTKVNNPAGAPLEPVVAAVPIKSEPVAVDTRKPDSPLENPFEDSDLAKNPEPKFGPEMLPRTSFDASYDPRSESNATLTLWTHDKIKNNVKYNNTDNILTIEKKTSDESAVLYSDVYIEKGRLYHIEIEGAADAERLPVLVEVTRYAPTWTNCGLYQNQEFGKDWQTHTLTFRSRVDDQYARFAIVMKPQGIYKFRRVSMKEVLPDDAELTFGPELLRVSTFSDGYRPRWQDHDWHWQRQHQGRQLGTAEARQGALRLDVQHVMGPGLPQLFYAPFKIEKGKRYRVEVEMRSEKAEKIHMDVSSESPTYHQFRRWAVPIEKDWKVIQYDFTANESRDLARLHFSEFEVDKVYELRKASVREVVE